MLRKILGFLRDKGFRGKSLKSVPLPDVDPLLPYEEIEKTYGIRGMFDDVREEQLGVPPSDKYYNRREPDIDKEVRRLRKKLHMWGIA